MSEVPASVIEADIHRLEVGLRQLKVQYDMFFNGALSREPYELRNSIERIIRRYNNASIGKYVHRFHFNALVSRYNSFSELWNKTVRTREEGDRRASAVSALGKGTMAKCRITDPAEDREMLRLLHAHYEKMKERADGGSRRVPFESFLKGIGSQASKIRAKTGCDQVELRVVVRDGKVHLKARPVG